MMAEDKKGGIGGISVQIGGTLRYFLSFPHFYMHGIAFSAQVLLRNIR
jgi:hypothetical protein